MYYNTIRRAYLHLAVAIVGFIVLKRGFIGVGSMRLMCCWHSGRYIAGWLVSRRFYAGGNAGDPSGG